MSEQPEAQCESMAIPDERINGEDIDNVLISEGGSQYPERITIYLKEGKHITVGVDVFTWKRGLTARLELQRGFWGSIGPKPKEDNHG